VSGTDQVALIIQIVIEAVVALAMIIVAGPARSSVTEPKQTQGWARSAETDRRADFGGSCFGGVRTLPLPCLALVILPTPASRSLKPAADCPILALPNGRANATFAYTVGTRRGAGSARTATTVHIHHFAPLFDSHPVVFDGRDPAHRVSQEG
jgi:hypothetical protein